MERALISYVRALRLAGAAVSTADALDAAHTLALVGYADRALLKTALAIVLAKSEEEKALHDRLFDAFFARPDVEAEAAGAEDAADRARGEDGETDATEPGATGAETGASRAVTGESERDGAETLAALARSGDAGRIAAALERAAAGAGVDHIRFASQTAYYVRRMLERLGVDALEEELVARLQERTPAAEAQAEALIDLRRQMQSRVRAYVDQRFEAFGRSATETFMDEVVLNRPLSELGGRDMERMKDLAARMARRLAARHSRRRRQRRRGQLDNRRTLRANAGYDGVPFQLVWKQKRRDRPKIIAVCDVSGSVARYVQFLLLFLYALRERVADLGAFAFSNELKEVGTYLDTREFDSAFSAILRDAGGGSTDYGRAFSDLSADHGAVIDRRTTILVLGDGRSNFTDPRLDIFQDLVERAKRVVWLCPEPPGLWGSGDSCLLQYRPHCTQLIHCASAADLETAIDDLLLAYG
jgi:uncharacterized protein with von Willebrand factor type A (vWA) domain